MNNKQFGLFLDKVYEKHKKYFDERTDRYNHPNKCFAVLGKTNFGLRYAKLSNLDELIKSQVVNKYKELFGDNANYQEIEK